MDGHAPLTDDDTIPEGQRPLPESEVEPGYYEWLEEEIAAGLKELDEGKGIPAEDVWKSLGLE